MINNLTDEQLASYIEDNMGLVVLLARSFNPKSSNELDEYIQLGRIGVWKAIKNHDGNRAKLSTCVWHYIRWEILRYLDKEKKNNTYYHNIPESIISNNKGVDFWEFVPSCLSQKESNVLKMRLEGYTFSDIGKKMGYSRGWANNIFKSAIKKINNAHEKKNFNMQ